MSTTAAPIVGSYLPPSPSALAPISAPERIRELDILRGFAMIGVLWSNLWDWYTSDRIGPHLDHALEWMDTPLEFAQTWLIESRFYSLLGLLFGIGFSVQLIRAEQRGRDVRYTYMRRLFVLLVFGVLHATLLWFGDILTTYALVGFALLLYRGLSPRGLLIAAPLTFFGAPLIQSAITVPLLHARMVPRTNPLTHDWIFAHGSWTQITALRAEHYLDWHQRWALGGFGHFLTLFILGLWLGRVGFLADIPRRLPTIRKALVVATVTCAVGVLLTVYLDTLWPRPNTPTTDFATFAKRIPRSSIDLVPFWLMCWSQMVIYASVLVLLANRASKPVRFSGLAAVGRMPLTTYLTQSLVCSTLFYGYGLGLYGRVGSPTLLFVTIALFSAQVVFSKWWLARFEFGPAEWLWRALSYGRRPPMRRAVPA